MISIIVPFYNSRKYLVQTINSVLSCTSREYELLLINDGSTDHSEQLCTPFLCENVKIFSQKHSGVSTARNLGIAHAKGDYIMFLDSDDMLSPNAVENFLNEIKKKPVAPDYLQSSIRVFGRENKIREIKAADYTNETVDPWFLFDSCSQCHGRIYKRQVIEENHLTFNTKYFYGEDTLFTFQFLKCCKYISFAEFISCNYRKAYIKSSFPHFISRYEAVSPDVFVEIFDTIKDISIAHTMSENNKGDFSNIPHIPDELYTEFLGRYSIFYVKNNRSISVCSSLISELASRVHKINNNSFLQYSKFSRLENSLFKSGKFKLFVVCQKMNNNILWKLFRHFCNCFRNCF